MRRCLPCNVWLCGAQDSPAAASCSTPTLSPFPLIPFPNISTRLKLSIMACPHVASVRLSVPSYNAQIYKDECTFCFDSPVSTSFSPLVVSSLAQGRVSTADHCAFSWPSNLCSLLLFLHNGSDMGSVERKTKAVWTYVYRVSTADAPTRIAIMLFNTTPKPATL
jgi:hypothetical protein